MGCKVTPRSGMSTGSDQYPLLGIIDQLTPSKDVESVAFSDLERERDTIFLELEQLFESKDAVCVTKEQEPEETKLDATGDLTEISSEYPMADASSYCPPTLLLDYSSELPPAIYWMGSQRISVGEADRAYLVQIRPDISHDVVVALVEQVLMTNCGVVKIVEAANGISGGGKTTFEVHSCLECASLRCYIGVTRDRQRGKVFAAQHPCVSLNTHTHEPNLLLCYSPRRFAPHGTIYTKVFTASATAPFNHVTSSRRNFPWFKCRFFCKIS